MKQPVFVSKELRSAKSGVYLIYFATGYFYIGSSTNLKIRIQTHICFVRSGGESKSGSKSLQRVTDFTGGASFYLLESVDSSDRGYLFSKRVLDAEREHKVKYKNSPFLLNRIERMA